MGVDAKLGAPDMSAHHRQRLRTLQMQDQMSLLCDTRQRIPLSVGQQHQLLPSCKGWRDAILGQCAWAFGGLVPASDSTIPASKLLECWLLSAAVLPFAPLALPATITHPAEQHPPMRETRNARCVLCSTSCRGSGYGAPGGKSAEAAQLARESRAGHVQAGDLP